MVKVYLDKIVLADSNAPVTLEGNYYFPLDSVKKEYLTPSTTSTVCSRKGTASYYSAEVEGKTINDIAWYYAEPTAEAHIKNHVAFYKNKVRIED